MRKAAWVPVVLAAAWISACGTGKARQEKVLAMVNGQPITESMLEEEARSLPPYVQPMLETAAGREQFLESLITRDLLMQEAIRRGIDRRDDVRGRLGMARRSILLEALLREVTDNAPGLSDDALKKFYADNQESFRVGERVKVSHVLFKDRAKADEWVRKAENGMPFEAIMKEAPKDDGVAADLGFIERGKFDKGFEDAAFAAPAGKVTGPVRTVYGFHLLRTGEKRPAGIQPFDEVKGQIAAELREQAQREAFESLLEQMKRQARIQVFAPRGEGAPPVSGTPRVPGSASQPSGSGAPGGGR